MLHTRVNRGVKTEGGLGPLGPSQPLVQVDLPHVHPQHREGMMGETFGRSKWLAAKPFIRACRPCDGMDSGARHYNGDW
jgi:hypothetical protein